MKATAFGLAVALASSAWAQGTLYAIRESDNTLISYDPNTLQQTVIGPLNAPGDFGDLAWNETNQTMYYIDGRGGNSALYTVDLNTGNATLVGKHGQPEMFALEWDSSTNRMFAGQSTQATGFWEINPANGSANKISSVNINLDSLAYDSSRDMLVGAFAGPGDLYKMDRNTGNATLIYDGPFFNNGGLAYDRDLFWFGDWSGIIYQFDPNNGYQVSQALTGQGAIDGLVYVPRVPVPGAGALLLGAGLAGGRRPAATGPERSDQIEPSLTSVTPWPSRRAQKASVPSAAIRGWARRAKVIPGRPGAGSPERAMGVRETSTGADPASAERAKAARPECNFIAHPRVIGPRPLFRGQDCGIPRYTFARFRQRLP